MIEYRDSIIEQLRDDFDNWELRGILADWYEEVGDLGKANCLRWMIKNKKRPWLSEEGYCCWFDARKQFYLSDEESDLPHEVYVLLDEKDCWRVSMSHLSYKTVELAELALEKALEKL